MQRLLCFVGLALSLATPGLAASFDYSAGAWRQSSVASMTSGGIGLALSAEAADDPSQTFDVALGGGWGLGVLGIGDDMAQASQVESWGAAPELLRFSFDTAVRIETITFAWVDWQDRATLGYVDGSRLTFKIDDLSGRADLSAVTFGGSGPVGTEFTLAPLSWQLCLHFSSGQRCGDQESGFRVTSIEVSALPPEVPLPLPAIMLLTGVVALGVAARRTTRSR